MSKNTYPLKLPTSVKKAAAELAATDGVSLNQFIAAAIAERVGSLRAADDFLRERAGTAKPKDMLKYLRRALENRGRYLFRRRTIPRRPRCAGGRYTHRSARIRQHRHWPAATEDGSRCWSRRT